jgi:RNA recognition motif-containing protein
LRNLLFLIPQKRQLNEYSTPKAFRQLQSVCSTPFKPEPDQASCSSDFSDWSVVERTSRRLKYSGGGDSSSETINNSLRIHVNHISPFTSEKSLRDYFSRFGDIEDVFIRGPEFAFVTFSCYYEESPLETSEHFIDGRFVEFWLNNLPNLYIFELYRSQVELTVAKRSFKSNGKPSTKLLVTPVDSKLTNEKLRNHFSKYGNIIDISRGSNVAFVLFDSPQCIDKAFIHDHVIDGIEVQIRRVREGDANERSEVKTKTILVSADVEIMKKITVSDLKAYFEPFGKIVAVRKPTVQSEATHFSFVQFASTDAVEKVLGELNFGTGGLW